jgi:ARP2/3 complex 20 kDa subunit (ARPC4)
MYKHKLVDFIIQFIEVGKEISEMKLLTEVCNEIEKVS